MAKRYTDSEKWRKPWFRSLTFEAKLAWGYLTDNCDHAGIWPAAFDLMSADLGRTITAQHLDDWFGDKIIAFEDKYFLPGYIEFQYGTLKSESKPHQSVIKNLVRHGFDPLTLAKIEQYPKGIHTLKDKDKDQAKEKERAIFSSLPVFTQDQLRQKYVPEFLAEGLSECVLYHSSDPASVMWMPQRWGKALTAWLLEKKRREDKNQPHKKAAGDICGVAD